MDIPQNVSADELSCVFWYNFMAELTTVKIISKNFSLFPIWYGTKYSLVHYFKYAMN